MLKCNLSLYKTPKEKTTRNYKTHHLITHATTPSQHANHHHHVTHRNRLSIPAMVGQPNRKKSSQCHRKVNALNGCDFSSKVDTPFRLPRNLGILYMGPTLNAWRCDHKYIK